MAGETSCGSTRCTTLISLTTGRLHLGRSLDALDLDAKSPTKVARCPALDVANEVGGLSGVGPRRALTSSSRDVLLTSCRHRTVLARESARVQGLQLRGGLAGWDTGIAGADFLAGEFVPRSVVVVRDLDSGRTTRRPAPRGRSSGCGETSVRGSFGISSHTRHDLFWKQTSRIDVDRICSIDRVRVLVTALRR